MDAKKLLYVALLFLVSMFQGLAEEIDLNVHNISEDLLKNAEAVIRDKKETLIIEDSQKSVRIVDEYITVLKGSGYSFSRLREYQDKFTNIQNVKATIFDEFGNEVKKIKKQDIHDISANIGIHTLYSDARIFYIDPEYKIYPFTIHYYYEVHSKNPLIMSDWQVYEGYNVSVESSAFKIRTPNNYNVRFLEKNIPEGTLKKETADGVKTYAWNFNDLKALSKEAFSPSLKSYTPSLLISPSTFEIDGYKGDASSWESFGKFKYQLIEGRDILPEDAKNKIKELVKNVDSDLEKVKILYKYLQDKTRYVSLQVGIGGWQPIDAATVDRLSYGDCKALSNYMKSILSVVGIKSYYASIRAGKNASNINVDFPSNQTNHIILCVPLSNDTIWLECTSQSNPFGYLGTFTDNRMALLNTEDGGVLKKTKSYSTGDNLQSRCFEIELQEDGNASAEINTKYLGINYDYIIPIVESDKADSKKYIENRLDIPSFELLNYNYVVKKEQMPCIEENLTVELPNLATSYGNRLILKLYPFNEQYNIGYAERYSPIEIKRGSTVIDSVFYKLPEGFFASNLPDKIELQSKFGSYSIQSEIIEERVLFVRKFVLNPGNYPKGDYQQLADYFLEVIKNDKTKIILKKEA